MLVLIYTNIADDNVI